MCCTSFCRSSDAVRVVLQMSVDVRRTRPTVLSAFRRLLRGAAARSCGGLRLAGLFGYLEQLVEVTTERVADLLRGSSLQRVASGLDRVDPCPRHFALKGEVALRPSSRSSCCFQLVLFRYYHDGPPFRYVRSSALRLQL